MIMPGVWRGNYARTTINANNPTEKMEIVVRAGAEGSN
jgi:hypothetical protein